MAYHFIGIGGIGMSGLARILLQKGQKVSGSDMATNYVTEGLKATGAQVYLGHKAENVPEKATVIYSTDIPKDNPELQVARDKKYPLLHRSDLLLALMQEKKILAVTGTHGKTTTSSLMTHVFKTAGSDPAFAVGGVLNGLEINGAWGKGDYFIAEADESDGTFLKYPYFGAIVTNVDNDHLAHFGSWEALVDGFKTFLNRSNHPQFLIYCQDDPTLMGLKIPGTSYGFSEQADYHITNFRQSAWQITFDVQNKAKSYKDVVCSLTGRHNALNACAVFAMSLACGLDEQAIRKGLSTFNGVKRRLEKKGEASGYLAIDDYAHHPTEIKATLKALRAAVVNRGIVAVFQPHRYSRMRYVMNDFDNVFDDADLVVVTDLFTANEAPVDGVSTESIIEKIKKSAPNCLYLPRKTLVEALASHIPASSVLITLGAGDITKVGKEFIEHVQKQ